MERSNFALRLLPSLHKALQRAAEHEHCSVNQLINIAVAEKLAVMDAEYWNESKRAAVRKGNSSVLERLAGNQAPAPGDEVPGPIPARRRSGKKLKVS